MREYKTVKSLRFLGNHDVDALLIRPGRVEQTTEGMEAFMAKYDKLYAEYKALEKASGFGAKHKAQKTPEAANDYSNTHSMELTSASWS